MGTLAGSFVFGPGSGLGGAFVFESGATYTLTADAGSYSLSGQAADFSRTYALSAARGTYAVSGRAAGLDYSNAVAVLPPLPNWYYIPGPLPYDVPAWAQREFMSISRASFGAAPLVQFQVQAREPEKPRDGMVAFADGTSWNPGAGGGLYERVAGAWQKL